MPRWVIQRFVSARWPASEAQRDFLGWSEKGRAAEILLRGRVVAAEEALQIGLVQSVVEPEDLLVETNAMIRDILTHAPIAVKLTWEAIHRGLNMTLEESTLLGTDYFRLVASTDDFRVGTKAFIEEQSAS